VVVIVPPASFRRLHVTKTRLHDAATNYLGPGRSSGSR
jgi:hypothetical protein